MNDLFYMCGIFLIQDVQSDSTLKADDIKKELNDIN